MNEITSPDLSIEDFQGFIFFISYFVFLELNNISHCQQSQQRENALTIVL